MVLDVLLDLPLPLTYCQDIVARWLVFASRVRGLRVPRALTAQLSQSWATGMEKRLLGVMRHSRVKPSNSPERRRKDFGEVFINGYINWFLWLVVFLTGHSQQHIGEDHRARSSNLSGRASSQTNVYHDTFGYQDNSRGFDTLSVDSSDSMETSISACSPDNVSRWGRFFHYSFITQNQINVNMELSFFFKVTIIQ